MTTTQFEVLVVSSDLENRRNLSKILLKDGLDPLCVSTLRECQEILAGRRIALVFCDAHVTDGSYEDLLAAHRSKESKPRVVITSLHANWDEFRKAIRLGAFDVISSPCRPTDVEWMIIQAKRDERNRPVATFFNGPDPTKAVVLPSAS